MKYVFLTASEVSGIDFSKVLQDSASTLRYNNDNSKTFVKYKGDKPSFLDSKAELTREEAFLELKKAEWRLEE